MPEIQIMPSILAADTGRLADACSRAEAAGADQLHVDIMDGVFVPNISFGPNVVAMAKQESTLPLNVHLMVKYPQDHVESFALAGSDTILIHIEAACDVLEVLKSIRGLGKRPGLTVNPETPVHSLFDYVDARLVDEVLVMSVHPGFGGQCYMASTEEKLRALRKRADWLDLSVDGGVDGETVRSAAAAGANLFVAGSYLFGQDDMIAGIRRLREQAQENFCRSVNEVTE